MTNPIRVHEGTCGAFWGSGCRKNAGSSHGCIIWNSWHRADSDRKCQCDCGTKMGD